MNVVKLGAMPSHPEALAPSLSLIHISAYRRDCAPHRLVLMSSPGPLTPDLADAFRRYLSGTVMTFSER